jgi:fatty acid desaturase
LSAEAAAAPSAARSKNAWRDAFTPEEFESLREVVAWRSWLTVILNWAMIAGLFALVAVWPNPLTIVVALIGLGGRQLGCAVIMHEAAHRTLFRSRRLNEWVGNWLGAYPSWSGEVEPYRRYHAVHHAHTGSERDPDLKLATAFPVTRRSLLRKIWRDLSGQTGWKQAKLLIQRDLGVGSRRNQRNRGLKVGQRPDVGWHKLAPIAITNGVIFGACWLAGHPAVYALWPLAWLTTYRLALRVRSIAEHGMAEQGDDPFHNTRTILASWWARFFFAPNRVNYHLEHHLVMTIPHYHLPRFHRMLRERGLLDDALLDRGYVDVLRKVSVAPAAA